MRNFVQLEGNLTADVYFGKGKQSNYSYATVAQNKKDKDGNEHAVFVDVAAYGSTADRFKELKKGSYIQVEGRLANTQGELAGKKIQGLRLVISRYHLL